MEEFGLLVPRRGQILVYTLIEKSQFIKGNLSTSEQSACTPTV
jgi:hypothetical protein